MPPPAHEDEPKLPFARTLIIAILLIALLLVLQTSWDRLALNVSDGFTRTPIGIVPESLPVEAQAETDSRNAVAADTLSLGDPIQPIGGSAKSPAEHDAIQPQRDGANAP